ncbi:MAG: CHAD domain-containing protein [Terriglobia bacterium]|jgi:CHAD domain-containing protein
MRAEVHHEAFEMDEGNTAMSSAAPLVELPAPHAVPRKKRPSEKPATPIPAERDDDWGKVRALARKQLDRFMSLESKVLRNSDPDDIHDVRVASRRLQQVVDLLYPPPQPREIRKLRRVMRRSRRAFSDVRNCDVLLGQVRSRLARKRTTRRDVWEAVEAYLQQRRSENFEKALRKVSKVNMAVFYVHLRKYLNGSGGASNHHHVPLAAVSSNDSAPKPFHERIGQSLEQVSQAFLAQISQSHHDRRASVIHAARIATKRLRYLVEVIHEFNVPGSDDAISWLRDLQQRLGEWHDLEVLEEMMIQMVARPEFLKEHLPTAMGVEKLVLLTRKSKMHLEEKYVEMTKDSPDFRRMRNWVAYVLSSPSAAFATP